MLKNENKQVLGC